jgi:transcriptional regulator with XRE-family HTH domain
MKIKRGFQQWLSQQTGWGKSYISQVLNAVARPSWARAQKLSQVTGIDPSVWMSMDAGKIAHAIADRHAQEQLQKQVF